MEITRLHRQVTFRFEKKDWKVRNGQACKDFLSEMKDLIPWEHRDFDSMTSLWTIEASYFDAVVDQLRKKYFVDPNQPELF